MLEFGNLVIIVIYVYVINKLLLFYVVLFISFKDDKIIFIDEYWGEDDDVL